MSKTPPRRALASIKLRPAPSIGLFVIFVAAASAQPPTVISVTPLSGTGTSVTFTATFNDPRGANNIDVAELGIVTSLGANPGCAFGYEFGAFWLVNDAGTALSQPVYPGSSTTVSNSQCIITGQGASATLSGTTLTWTMRVTFSASYTGTKQLWLNVTDSSNGLSSGWQNPESWTVGPNQPPSGVSISPSSGTGASVTFTGTFSDPEGATQIDVAELGIVTSLGSTPACFFGYEFGAFWLPNDAGTALNGPVYPGSSTTVSNSQCTITGQGASASYSGTTLTWIMPVTFSTSYAGPKQLSVNVTDSITGLASGWQNMGSWTVGTNQPPSVTSISPSVGTGYSTTVTAAFTDPEGVNQIDVAELGIVNSLGTNPACSFGYEFGAF